MKVAITLVGVVVVIGCGVAPQARVMAKAEPARYVAEPPPPPTPPPGAIWREDVVKTVNLGLGHFLQHLDVEARLEYGEFRGWTVKDLRPRSFWAGVDLRPGDVVLSVNDLPIERDTQAFTAFESLKAANQLSVTYQRGGETRTLSYKIVARAAPPSAASATNPVSPSSAQRPGHLATQ